MRLLANPRPDRESGPTGVATAGVGVSVAVSESTSTARAASGSGRAPGAKRFRRGWIWAPYAGGVLALLAGIVFWRALIAFEQTHVEEATRIAAAGVAADVAEHARALTESLQLLGDAAEKVGAPRWQRQGSLVLEQFPALLAIELIDETGRPLDRIARGTIEAVPTPTDLPQLERGATWMSGVATIDAKPSVWLVVPTSASKKVVALLRLDEFAADALSPQQRRHSITLLAGEETVFETHPPEDGAPVAWRPISLAASGEQFRMRVAASSRLAGTARSPLPLIGLGLALVIAGLVVLSMRAAAAERHRSHELAEQGRLLEEEIGERRWAEEELRALNRQLDERVRHRTGELASVVEQLATENRVRRRVQAQLERMNKSLREFDAFISHELRQPLSALQIWAELLEASPGELTEKRREYIQKAKSEIQRMARMIENELRLSKAAHGEVPTDPVPLTPIVQEVAADLAPKLETADARVDVGELPAALIDADQARQIFTNLIENAIRYRRPDATLEIRIESRREDVPAEFCEIVVSDNGQGFDTTASEQLFQAFRRGTETAEGSGLGLAICRRIVEHHGGSIRAEGTPGEGATFTIRLPTPGEG